MKEETILKVPKGYLMSLDDLWDVIKRASEKGLPMDTMVRFSLLGDCSFVVSDEEWNNSKIMKNWNDHLDPEDRKKTYKEIEKHYDFGGCQLDGGMTSETIVTINDNEITFKLKDCKCI